MWTVTFWKATAERALSAAAQGAVTAWLGDAALPQGLPGWAVLAAAGTMALLTLFKCLIAAQVGNSGPSLVSAEKLVSPK